MLRLCKKKLYTPTIENAEQLLTDLCFSNARAIYGEVLPQLVEDRLPKRIG